ncbi:hypothetical protein QBC33DRAFT_533642 [Phialemonium atrogriseum]|uniref:Uncharacterized protein n=1 Tax=Phialemonium atrogriseum TaxID=1093897 RepID=A0AAJ0FHN5_9PEZI|nr:uncharacterized protein QBC33DRAFT_533642 [Phialemonium atrogriseum]KAK1768776.1 hypothetical protein QBC33DRAFT_533642 [Phialemonium atrogriseum]
MSSISQNGQLGQPLPCQQNQVAAKFWDSSWGWVIYRCTYAPELAARWETFKRLVDEKMREFVAQSDAPEIVDQLEWVFVDQDPELEGASLDKLKRRYRAWAREENQNLNYDIDHMPVGVSRGSRYTYFIQVDEEALRSLPVDKGEVSNLTTCERA